MKIDFFGVKGRIEEGFNEEVDIVEKYKSNGNPNSALLITEENKSEWKPVS